MKRTKQNSRLKLRKEVVSSLTKNEQSVLLGGKAAITTSFMQCSGFTCCMPSRYCSLIGDCLEEGLENPD